jgi:hypothetical protein
MKRTVALRITKVCVILSATINHCLLSPYIYLKESIIITSIEICDLMSLSIKTAFPKQYTNPFRDDNRKHLYKKTRLKVIKLYRIFKALTMSQLLILLRDHIVYKFYHKLNEI